MRTTLSRLLALAATALLPPFAAHAQAQAQAVATNATVAATPAEQHYLGTRDAFVRSFRQHKELDDTRDRQALEVLRAQLAAIVGQVQVTGFPPPAAINLQTLQQDGGFGMVDGLRLGDAAGQHILVATTPALLADYARRHPGLPTGLPALWRNGTFVRLAFDWDAAVTLGTSLPVRRRPGQQQVLAFVGTAAQDVGPFPPNHLYVFSANGRQVLMASVQLQPELPQIDACRQSWEKFEQTRMEEQGFRAYTACYSRELLRQPGFAPLLAQAQALLDRLR